MSLTISFNDDIYAAPTFYATFFLALSTAILALGTFWLTWITRSKNKNDFEVGKADYMLRINSRLQIFVPIRELILSTSEASRPIVLNLRNQTIVQIRDYTIEFESIYRHIESKIFDDEEAYQYFGARFHELMTSEVMKSVYLRDEFKDMGNSLRKFKNIVERHRALNNLDNNKEWYISEYRAEISWPIRRVVPRDA